MGLLILFLLLLGLVVNTPPVSIFLHPFWITFAALWLLGTIILPTFYGKLQKNLLYNFCSMAATICVYIYGLAVGFLPEIFALFIIGSVANGVARYANNLKMPVCPIQFGRLQQLSYIIIGLDFRHCFIDKETRLRHLCDTIYILGGIYSIGDIFIYSSMLIFAICYLLGL
ncbi:MAG: DUF5317 family protein [Candidatus Yanofskybacteria bacterium]|nr:DUF5317 family protein [Candidatus Yanofskybacteria bacterium]